MALLATLTREFETKLAEGQALLTKHSAAAQEGDRLLTEEEKTEIQTATAGLRDLKAKIEKQDGDAAVMGELERIMASAVPAKSTPRGVVRLSMGEQFIRHPQYREYFLKGRQHRAQSTWRSPSIELFDPGMRAANLTEDPASGGALLVPQYLPGILPLQFYPPTVADLFAQGTVSVNAIVYMVEKTFTNAAAAVAEAAAKPESTLTFESRTEPVRKLAHWLPVSEEMLEDEPQIRSYIDARLRLGIELEKDDQLLNGDGVGANILGVRARPNLAADVVRAPTEPNTDAIFRQRMAIWTTSLLVPDAVVMNPGDWSTTALMKTTTGEYIGGTPFAGGIVGPNLWGMPVVITPNIPLGVALVGAFKTAGQVFLHGGIRVEASNSHADFFIKNLVAIRAEQRLALAIYRPGAFGEVTGLGAVA